METTSAAPLPLPSLRKDAGFLRLLVVVNGGVPLAMLAWDAWRHQLGVNGVNFAIRTTGLLGLIFLLLSLAISPLRRLTGWAVLIAPRRALGLYAFLYLSVHFSIFFGFDRAASVSSTVHEILSRRYLQIGSIALVLLVPLAVTSTDAMVMRLGARRWKALHRLAYLATALGALHYYLLVKADVRQPLAFAGVLAALLGFRLVQRRVDQRKRRPALAASPVVAASRRFWSGELQVLRIFAETPDVRTFRLGLASGAPLPFAYQPGQYLSIALEIDGVRVNRSYTIASSPTQLQYCELTVKEKSMGYASRHLHRSLSEGDTVKISAPAGRFVFTGASAEGVVLIGAGVGITPLMSIVRYLTDHSWPGAIDLVFAARKVEDVIFLDELARLERRFPNFRLTVTLSGEPHGSGWQGRRGRASGELVAELIPNLSARPIYLCGPASMMEETRAALLSLGISDGQIKTEAFVTGTGGAEEPADGVAPVSAAGAPVSVVTSEASGEAATVNFSRSMKIAAMTSEQTILECAEDAGVDIPFECRSGICGQCKTQLLKGTVVMDVQDALSAGERSRGLILACQARATSDVSIDA